MNYDEMALNLIKREAREQKQIEQRLKAAQRVITELVTDFLEIDPTLQKVILFGSLAKNRVRSVNFDIDLAVQGSQDKFLSLVACTLDREFKVDIVDLNSVNPTWREFIQREGVLYNLNRSIPPGIQHFYELHQGYLDKLDLLIEQIEALE